MFQSKEKIAGWLLISQATFPELLRPLYLPLENQVETPIVIAIFFAITTHTHTQLSTQLVVWRNDIPYDTALWLLLKNDSVKLQIRIANLSVDGKTATLWEYYQVAKELEQRLVLVGCWMNIRVCSEKFDEVRLLLVWFCQSTVQRSPVPCEAKSRVSIPSGGENTPVWWSRGPVNDPLQRRQDLTDLHFTWVTIDVRLVT